MNDRSTVDVKRQTKQTLRSLKVIHDIKKKTGLARIALAIN